MRTLVGSGELTLSFGNPFVKGVVTAYLNDQKIAEAARRTTNKEVTATFSDGDVLKVEEANGIIVVHSVSFEC